MAAKDNDRTVKIGLFDSGVGGLSVLRKLERLSSLNSKQQYQFIYVGDTARCPYGNRSEDEILAFVDEIVSWLHTQQIDHLVMACNTSAAIGARFARSISPQPVHDLIEPAARYAARRYRKIGVLATHSTVRSHAFARAIQALDSQAQVFETACPALVPLVESGQIDGDLAREAVARYTEDFLEKRVEAIILGCTHFPFLEKVIRESVQDNMELIDPSAMLLQDLLSSLGITGRASNASSEDFRSPKESKTPGAAPCPVKFYVTGDPSSFATASDICLGNQIGTLAAGGSITRLSLKELAAASTLKPARPGMASAPQMIPLAAPSPETGNSNIIAT